MPLLHSYFLQMSLEIAQHKLLHRSPCDGAMIVAMVAPGWRTGSHEVFGDIDVVKTLLVMRRGSVWPDDTTRPINKPSWSTHTHSSIFHIMANCSPTCGN